MYADAAVFASHRLKPAKTRLMTVEVDSANLMRSQTAPAQVQTLRSTINISTPGGGPPPLPLSTAAPASSASTTVSSPNGSTQLSQPLANDSIINRKADPALGLYQTCATLRKRLRDVPGFEETFFAGEPDNDPVNMLWKVFQKGSSLCFIFNALRPRAPIEEEQLKPNLESKNIRKKACYYFLQGIKNELGMEGEEVFMISHLWSEDTNGFVKVTKTVSKVVDEIEVRGFLIKRDESKDSQDDEDTQPLSKRMRHINEFVETERKYVQDLEVLQDYMTCLQNSEVASPDLIHNLFLNLNSLLDFQRRFLIRVETTYAQPTDEQRWGQVLVSHEHAFDVYEPFCANLSSAQDLAVAENARLSSVAHPINEPGGTGILGFLIKPIQRLCKYPLLLRDMMKDCDKEQAEDFTEGIAAVERINLKVNEAVRKVDNTKVVEDLRARVDDWKGHRLEQFGPLLLNGQFTVIKGEGRGEIEREYQIYLFQKILLCCKEVVPSRRQKNTMSMGKNKSAANGKKSKLLLKGRIFMQNVTDIVWVASAGSYTLQIFWKGDPGVEDFVIKHKTPETLNQWKVQLQAQVDACRQETGLRSNGSTRNTSSTEFMWMQNSTKEHDAARSEDDVSDDDDEPEDSGDGYNAAYSNGYWNESTQSVLPAYSSGLSNGQVLPAYSSGMSAAPAYSSGVPQGLPSNPRQPRFAHQSQGSIASQSSQQPPLTLVTHAIPGSGGTQSPNGNDYSYFSPTSETPIGSRGSTSSGAYPFPRQPTPNYHDDPRYPGGTPMSRTASREGSGQASVSNSRLQRPSLPGMSPGGTMQNRMRSASSPNIHHLPNGQMRGAIPPVPVPPLPQTYQAYNGGPAVINRSQNSSPASPDGIPSRHASPGLPTQPRLTGSGSLSKSVQVPQVKVCVQFGHEEYIIIVPFNIPYAQLMDRVERKVRISQNAAHLAAPGNLKVKYRDEDGDLISMSSDDDVVMAFDLVISGGSNGIVMLFVSP